MAKLAVGFGVFQRIRILRPDGVGTVVVNADDFFVGKFILSKRRFDMALIGAIDFFGNRIVWNSGNVSMTVTAFDTSVNAMVVKDFINIIIPAPAVFIDSSHLSMFMAQKAVVFVGCFGPGAEQ
jgi:hypothetical protein